MMTKLEIFILKENYQDLYDRLSNVHRYLSELNNVISMNWQLKDDVKFNDEQLEIFKTLKENYLIPFYKPYDKDEIEKSLQKISLVIQSIEERKK